ncbi:MAG: hypothetical protein Q9195_009345 [Heterodermia aff. obscurata]
MNGSDITIDEDIRGTAELYGSGILNNKFFERFHSFTEQRDISYTPRSQLRGAMTASRPAIDSEVLKEFEAKKKSFENELDKKLAIIRELFDEIIHEILDMIKEQIIAFNQVVGSTSESRLQVSPEPHQHMFRIELIVSKRILLVEGFSENEYFRETITNACAGPNSFADYDIQITKPNEQS